MTAFAQSCLILFAKWPAPGCVKTRLCPPLSAGQAAELYQAMVDDVVRATDPGFWAQGALRLALWDERPAGQATPSEPIVPELAALSGDGRPLVVAQQGADLGERLADAFARAFAGGFGRVVVRNTDSPCLPWARVAAAFEALAHPGIDCVLGPDHGGGYYLVGLRPSEARLFDHLSRWPPGEVFARTVARARTLGMGTLVLPAEPDVDTPSDLSALVRELLADPERAPLTAAVLERWRRGGIGIS